MQQQEWQLVATVTPLRLGKPLTSIRFVFHGEEHSRPDVGKSPVEDFVAANLETYRLNIDYQHGTHLTALPTAVVTGFDSDSQLRSGSTTAWVRDTREPELELIQQDGSHQNAPRTAGVRQG